MCRWRPMTSGSPPGWPIGAPARVPAPTGTRSPRPICWRAIWQGGAVPEEQGDWFADTEGNLTAPGDGVTPPTDEFGRDDPESLERERRRREREQRRSKSRKAKKAPKVEEPAAPSKPRRAPRARKARPAAPVDSAGAQPVSPE